MAAVSCAQLRSRPNEIGNAPDEVQATSSRVKSPSGPTQIEIERGLRSNLAERFGNIPVDGAIALEGCNQWQFRIFRGGQWNWFGVTVIRFPGAG